MAEAVVGYNIGVGLETETTYGTDAGSARVWFEYLSESVERTFETLVQVDTRGRVERNNAAQGRESVAGSFDVFVNSENIGYLLFYMLGTAAAPTDLGAGSGPYQHDITIDTGTSDSFTFETDYGEVAAKAKIATGCRMNSLSFDIADGYVTASAGLAGQTLDEDATPTAVSFTEWPRTFDFKDFALTVDGTDISIDVVGGTVNITAANVEDDYRQSNQQIQSLPAGTLSFDASLDLVYDPATVTAVQDFFEGAATDKAIVLTWTGDDAGGGTNHKLELTLPHCYCESASPMVSGPGERVMRNIQVKTLHDYDAGTPGFKAQLINTKSTTYA